MSRQPARRNPQPPVPKDLRELGRGDRPPIVIHPPMKPNYTVPGSETWPRTPAEPVGAPPSRPAAPPTLPPAPAPDDP